MAQASDSVSHNGNFTTVTQVQVEDGKSEQAQRFCQSLIASILDEPGCLGAHLYRDAQHEQVLVYVVSWESEQAWQTHMHSQRQNERLQQADTGAGQGIVKGWSSQQLFEIAPKA